TEVSRIYASAPSSSPIQSVKSSDRSPSLQTKPCSSPSLSPLTPLFSPSPSTAFSFGGTHLRCLRRLTEVSRIYASASSSSPIQSVKSSDRSPSLQTKPCSSPSLSPSTPLFSLSPSTAFAFGGTRLRCLRRLISDSLPIKGRMAADTIDLLKVNGVSVPMKICILIIIWYGKDSVVWMDSDSNSDTDTDSEKDNENERKKQPVPFSHKFSKADPLALRLLERLLAFDPKDRASAEDALSDPYFSGLSNSEREPSTQPISKLEFDFERKKLTNNDVRELIYRKMLEEYKHGGDQLSFMYPRLASIFIEHILFKQ
ncbi:hypothetical protein HID58_088726, partial [Brassica napus]